MKFLIYCVFIIITSSFLIGCNNLFYSSTQGTSLNAGIYLPNNSNVDLKIISYLSGEHITVKDKCDIEYEFNCSETNSYFGLIKTEINRNGKIKVK